MSKVNLIIFVCLLFFCTFSTHAQESKLSIAVIDLKYDSSEYDWSKTVFLTNALANTEKYTVMERSKVKQVIDELGLQDTQYASDHASEIGNLLGVQKVITGKVFYCRKDRTMGRTLSVNLIDIESGAIEATATAEDVLRIRRNGRIFESDASTLKLSQRLLSELLTNCIKN